MKWASTLEIIDTGTGELLNSADKKEILKNYKILGKTKKLHIINTEFGRIHYQWLVTRKPEQLKLL